jgi:hypothetical protein
MYCPGCGTELPERAKFCKACGKAIVIASAESGDPSGIPVRAPSMPGLRRVLALAGAGTAAVVIVTVAAAWWHSRADKTPPAMAAVAVSHDQSQILHDRAGTCPGNPVTFGKTKIPADVSLDTAALCAVAREAVTRQEDLTRQMLSDLCASTKPDMERLYGTGDFAAVEQHLHESGADSDPSTRMATVVISNCAHPDAAIRAATANVPLQIYSVGRLTASGLSCTGYLEAMTGTKDGGSTAYELHGLKPCSDDSLKMTNVFNPVANPAGDAPGDAIRDRFAYTGELPDQWKYHGRMYAFGGKPIDPSKAAAAKADSSQPVAFAGGFDDIKALTAAFGPYDPALKAAHWTAANIPAAALHAGDDWCSMSRDARVRVVLSKSITEHDVEKHVLITAATAADYEGTGRSCTALIGVTVFAHNGNEWQAVEQTPYAKMAGSFGQAPPIDWVAVGIDRHALLITTLESQEEFHYSFSVYEKVDGTYSRPLLEINDVSSEDAFVATLEFVPDPSKPMFDAKLTSVKKDATGAPQPGSTREARFAFKDGQYLQVSNSGVPCETPAAPAAPTGEAGPQCLAGTQSAAAKPAVLTAQPVSASMSAVHQEQ